ncbi:GNAT family N-acetyltransferase [Shinella sp.]|uniref:GNAT family N-acetyltransferase n=1 Tax=Shinella sp. TaxID=1870904 RepID=UPI003D280EFE
MSTKGPGRKTFSHAANTKALKVVIETDAVRAIPVRAMDDDLSTTLETHTGLMLHVRTVKPVDEPLLADFFRHVTPEDLRFRFLGGVREVSHERLLAMAQVDHVATEHFLAFAGGSGAIVVAAMVACDPSMTKAEMAISVRTDDRHKGVGWEMLRHAAHYAQSRGISTLESLESRENHEVIEREQGFVAVPYPDDPTLFLIRKDLRST